MCCLICYDYAKGSLTANEAFKNLRETSPVSEEDHNHVSHVISILEEDPEFTHDDEDYYE